MKQILHRPIPFNSRGKNLSDKVNFPWVELFPQISDSRIRHSGVLGDQAKREIVACMGETSAIILSILAFVQKVRSPREGTVFFKQQSKTI